jgi:hypothetical protein
MQCPTCRTQLPGGAAHCPSCGSVTPYNISLSGVTPSETTVASSYVPSSLHPYPQPDPFSAPPPPPPMRRRGRSVVAAILVLLLVGAGGVLYFRMVSPPKPKSHASPTPLAQRATVIPLTRMPLDLYHQVTQSPAVLDDPLLTNDGNNWTESASADGKSSCQFTGGAYHAITQPQNTYMLCMAQAAHFGDLAYQVQMTIAKGDFGGIVFRADGLQTKYYSFFIDRSGTYTLITSVDGTFARVGFLKK